MWLDAGNTGTVADFFESLRGPKGNPGTNSELQRYVALDPIVQEMSDVAVSTSGQLYALSSVPSDRFCLVQLLIEAGLPASASAIAIAVEGSTISNRTAPNLPVGAGYSTPTPSVGMFWANGAQSIGGGAQVIWVPTTTGQVWLQRSGNYFGATTQTNVLGYIEGEAQ